MSKDTVNFHERPQARGRNYFPIAGLRAVVVLVALLIYAVLSTDSITNSQGLAAYTVLLLSYLFVEARNLWKHEPHLFWINPVVLASVFTFALVFGLSNVLFYMPEEVVALVGLKPIATIWMNQLMLLVILGAGSMWIGYSSGLGYSMGRMLQRNRMLCRCMSSSVGVNKSPLFAILAISLIVRLVSIKLGIYGYSSTYDQLVEGANYHEYLSMAESLGKLALVALGIQCFASPRLIPLDSLLLWLVLGYEVAFGFIYGFKSAVVTPFIIVGFVYYSQRTKFPRWSIPVVVVVIITAYAIIEPFRAERNRDRTFDGASISSIVTTLTSPTSIEAHASENRAPTALRLLSSTNLTYVASMGIEYAAQKTLPEGSPDFLSNIFLAPLHAITPRFIWSEKPLQNLGLWYNKEVMGHSFYNFIGMSPFTYLNFAGGPLAVILGFLIVGILQRGLFDGLRGFGGGGLIVLFGLLGTLTNIDSAFNTFFISLIRFLPLLVIVQYMLLKPSRRSLGDPRMSNVHLWQTNLLSQDVEGNR